MYTLLAKIIIRKSEFFLLVTIRHSSLDLKIDLNLFLVRKQVLYKMRFVQQEGSVEEHLMNVLLPLLSMLAYDKYWHLLGSIESFPPYFTQSLGWGWEWMFSTQVEL